MNLYVTLFADFKSCRGNITIQEALNQIKSGKYASPVNNMRQLMEQGNADAAEALKKKLPAITISGTYQKRRLKEYLTGYNPLVILDIDKQKKEDLPRLLGRIREAPYTVACWISPRGLGIKILVYPAVKMALTAENHPAIYDRVKDWYEEWLGVGIDTSGRDVGRLCLFSYDPELYLSPRFESWLEGRGELPADLPPIVPTVPKEVRDQIQKARKNATRKFAYADGNRNNYVYLFACHCNRLGVARRMVEIYAAEAFADLPLQEQQQAIDSAYSHAGQQVSPAAERGKGKQHNGMVERIEEFISGLFSLRRNVVRRLVEYRRLKSHKGFLPVTDYWENTLWCALQKEGVRCHLSDLRAVIHSEFSPEYDPFKAYFEKLPKWDGEDDAIGRLAATVSTTQTEYWTKCLKKWLVSVVACAIDEGVENHTVLLLSGEQGLGKTTWLRNLVPPALKLYVYSGNLDPSSKDSSLMMSDCFLIVLDELSGQSRMELNRLKALITKDSVRERRPYARNAETYTRRASFAATVNDNQVLTDRTGSRRFLCFEATKIDYALPIDHTAIYSQALALYKDGFRYWFADDDIPEVNLNNESFQQTSPEEELFYTYFRKPVRFESPILLSCSEIVAKIAEKTRFPMTSISVNNLGKLLSREHLEWKKKHGKRLFSVIELTVEQVEARRKGFGNDLEDEPKSVEDESDNESDPPEPLLPF